MEEKEKNAMPAGRQDNASEKIQTLREMIYSAEKTLQGAKAMLLQLEGKKKVGRKRKAAEDGEEGTIIEGTFDGQIMIGMDGKQYPVPANYASKSKLVEGDMLKLTITPDGSFIYKQIGPAERKRLIGSVNQDEDGNYFIIADGKPFRVLLASVTYFKVEPGDEVTLVVPRDLNSDWGSIENVIQKNKGSFGGYSGRPSQEEDIESAGESEKSDDKKSELSIIDEWAPDFEELKKELNKTDE